MFPGLSGGFSAINNQNTLIGGGGGPFNNPGSGPNFGHSRDFDSMSAALSGNNSTTGFRLKPMHSKL